MENLKDKIIYLIQGMFVIFMLFILPSILCTVFDLY